DVLGIVGVCSRLQDERSRAEHDVGDSRRELIAQGSRDVGCEQRRNALSVDRGRHLRKTNTGLRGELDASAHGRRRKSRGARSETESSCEVLASHAMAAPSKLMTAITAAHPRLGEWLAKATYRPAMPAMTSSEPIARRRKRGLPALPSAERSAPTLLG